MTVDPGRASPSGLDLRSGPHAGKYQAAQIPRSQFTLLPGEGHLLIIDRMPDLAAALRPAPPPRLPGENQHTCRG